MEKQLEDAFDQRLVSPCAIILGGVISLGTGGAGASSHRPLAEERQELARKSHR
jgi:hypothetical protein